MSYLINAIIDLHNYISYDMPGVLRRNRSIISLTIPACPAMERIHKTLSRYPLMGSPIPIIALSYLYWYFCTKLGPKLMKNREAFSLKWTLVAYNVIQVAANLYGVVWTYMTFSKFFSAGGYYLCVMKTNEVNANMDPVIQEQIYDELQKHTVYYIMLKLLDFIDTVFMVLKKNFRQITVLHVYHHGSMPIICIISAKYLPLTQEMYIGAANMSIHVIMYGYYLLTAYDSDFKKNLVIKKCITILQLLQFIFLMVMTTLITFQNNDCPISIMKSFASWIQTGLMIILFSNFYYKAYIRPKNKQT